MFKEIVTREFFKLSFKHLNILSTLKQIHVIHNISASDWPYTFLQPGFFV